MEKDTLNIFKYFVKPFIICVTIIICLIKIDNAANKLVKNINTVTIKTNYTKVINIEISTNDRQVLDSFPYTSPWQVVTND